MSRDGGQRFAWSTWSSQRARKARQLGRQTQKRCILAELGGVKEEINAYGYDADENLHLLSLDFELAKSNHNDKRRCHVKVRHRAYLKTEEGHWFPYGGNVDIQIRVLVRKQIVLCTAHLANCLATLFLPACLSQDLWNP